MMNETNAQSDPRPGLAMVAPTQEWYRHALHLRLVREIPELKLHSIYTHAQGLAHRPRRDESDINAVFFDSGGSSEQRNRLGNQLANLRRGSCIFEYFREHNVRAAVILGYNDLGLLRLFRRCSRAGIKTFLWSDSNADADRATGLKRLIKGTLIRSVARRTDAVLVCGTAGKRYYLDYNVLASKVIFSPCEPDYDLIRALPSAVIEETRQRFALGPARQRFVFCGRLVALKRPDLALAAFLALAPERPDWDLVIVGDGELRPQLEAQVPVNLKHRVLFTGFLSDQAAVSAIYRLSDALVHPSEIEPWGLIINEAVAAGLAVVSTTTCGAAVELVQEGQNGFLVPPGQLEPLTRAMRTISETDRVDAFKAQSKAALDRWRSIADPVQGIRTALARASILHGDPSNAQ